MAEVTIRGLEHLPQAEREYWQGVVDGLVPTSSPPGTQSGRKYEEGFAFGRLEFGRFEVALCRLIAGKTRRCRLITARVSYFTRADQNTKRALRQHLENMRAAR
jgi:hypothetical protein